MNLTLLQENLVISEHPGLDSTDPRFDEVASLVQAGAYIEAAVLSEALIANGIYDIRLICYFFYGYWLEEGIVCFSEIVNTFTHLLTHNWEAIGPVNKREKNIQSSLNWFCRLFLKKVQYEEKKNTVLWQQWLTVTHVEDVNQALLACQSLRLVIIENFDLNTANAIFELWSRIENWLQTFQALVTHPPEIQAETAEPENPPEDSKKSVPIPVFKVEHLNIELSYHMVLLLKKLAAFEYLLQEQKYPRAALVAEEINHALNSFDPMLYFPKTFEAFFRLQALNFDELSAYEGHKGSPQWQAMQEWLKIDVDSFMNN